MNSSSAAQEKKSNIIYGQIYGFVPYQIKPRLKRAPDLIKVKNGRELLKQNKDFNIDQLKKNVPYEAPSNKANHLYLKSSWGISVGLR